MKSLFVVLAVFAVIISAFEESPRSELAVDGQFPHQVRITIYGALVSALLVIGWCGGSIVSPEWIVTAAYCVARKPNPLPYLVAAFHIKAGSITTYQSRQQSTLLISDAHVHPNYDSTTLDSDIALLKTGKFDFSTPYVKPIGLPVVSLNILDYLGVMATASGFGPTSYNLQWTKVQVISKTACQEQYTNPISRSWLCAENPTMDGSVCHYDTGGPLIVSILGLSTLIGVASYSNGCVGAHGFTDVGMFAPWIYLTMATNSVDIK